MHEHEHNHDHPHTHSHPHGEAAAKLSEALHYFDHCNDALEEAVKLAKGE